MKNYILILLLLPLALIACVEKDNNNGDVNEKVHQAIIIDVRTKKEFNQGHLTNAINISYKKIKEEIKKYAPNKNQQIILYCRSGRRSGIALKTLKEMGYKNAVNAGSYKILKKKEKDRNKKLEEK